jgi:hypothetical protein
MTRQNESRAVQGPTNVKHEKDQSLPRYIGVEDFRRLFERPLSEAARELGVCETMFKKHCRRAVSLPRRAREEKRKGGGGGGLT